MPAADSLNCAGLIESGSQPHNGSQHASSNGSSTPSSEPSGSVVTSTCSTKACAGLPGTLVRFLTEIHPARNPRDVENYLARLGQLAPRLDEAIVEARARAARGIAPPRFILTATIDQIERLAAPEPGRNVLVESFDQRIENVASISADARRQFHSAAAKVVADSVVPSLRRVIALLDEQRKTATDEAGYSRLPEGTAAYAARLRNSTSTGLTADQIHQTGLEQVARIEGEMDKVLRQLNYLEGSVKERYQRAMDDYSYPDTPDVRTTILADYEKIIRDAEKRAGALFDLRPKASVVVRRIPEYQERNTRSAYYTLPARDGSRPGAFNVPLVGPKFSRLDMRSPAYHEAVPGHHFQSALQQEDKELPRFRADRILWEGTGAFAEGWGLYAEALAIESGWYDDDLPSKLGALQGQLWRAQRLVVDTGLHTKGWTRQQAIDYGISVSEVERYVANPGQACAYMIGQLKILELRDKTRRELGDKFSAEGISQCSPAHRHRSARSARGSGGRIHHHKEAALILLNHWVVIEIHKTERRSAGLSLSYGTDRVPYPFRWTQAMAESSTPREFFSPERARDYSPGQARQRAALGERDSRDGPSPPSREVQID